MYNKLFSKIVTSSIWLEPTPTRMIWITFLALMDEDGFAPVASVANLAHTARIDLDDATLAVSILESPDENSGDKDNDGRRIERVPGGWMVLNAKKYRDIVTRQVAREKTRERVKRFRERHVSNADVTLANVPVTPSETDTDTETEARKTPAAPDGLSPEAWEAWQGYRKLKKDSIPAAQRKLAKFGARQVEVVEHCIANGYKGLFAPTSASAQSGEWLVVIDAIKDPFKRDTVLPTIKSKVGRLGGFIHLGSLKPFDLEQKRKEFEALG